jgi:hypothetical protein
MLVLHLLLLDGLLQVAGGETLHVVDHDIVWEGGGFLLDDLCYFVLALKIGLLFLDAIA